MPSKQLYRLKPLITELRKLLKSYREIYDFIIFGSAVKDKLEPRDIDVAVITEHKKTGLIGEIGLKLDKFGKVDLEILDPKEMYTLKHDLYYKIMFSGFSIKENRFLPELGGIKPMSLYTYNLEGMKQTEKAQFNKGLRNVLRETNGKHIGRGALLIPENKTGNFEDFLRLWGRLTKTKKNDLILL
jgi:predicted nucleotidyltransferase